MNRIGRGGWMVLALICGLAAVGPVRADEAGEDNWQFFSPTYMWMSGLEGDVTLKGNTADIDLGFDEIFDHMDVGIQVYMELRKKKFGFFVQPNYMKLSADGSHASGASADFEQTLWIVEAGGFYQIVHTGEERPLTVDVIAGVRYWGIKNELELTGLPVPPFPSATFDAVGHTDLIDPIIGARARKNLTEKLFVSVRGDIGGFDLSDHTSRFSWQIMPLLGYDFNQYFTLFGGYRLLATEFESGSGASKQGANIQMHGVLLGFNFDFFEWLGRNK